MLVSSAFFSLIHGSYWKPPQPSASAGQHLSEFWLCLSGHWKPFPILWQHRDLQHPAGQPFPSWVSAWLPDCHLVACSRWSIALNFSLLGKGPDSPAGPQPPSCSSQQSARVLFQPGWSSPPPILCCPPLPDQLNISIIQRSAFPLLYSPPSTGWEPMDICTGYIKPRFPTCTYQFDPPQTNKYIY